MRTKTLTKQTVDYREWLLSKLIEYGDKPFTTRYHSDRHLYSRGTRNRHLEYELVQINGGTHIQGMFFITDRGRKYIMKVMR